MYASDVFRSRLHQALSKRGIPEPSPEDDWADRQIARYELIEASVEATLKWEEEALLAALAYLEGSEESASKHALRSIELFGGAKGKTLLEETLESCIPQQAKAPPKTHARCQQCGQHKTLDPGQLCGWCIDEAKHWGHYQEPRQEDARR